MSDTDIAVVIPSYLSEETLPMTLDAIENQLTSLKVEVVVVDSSPTSRVEDLCTEYAHVRILRLPDKTSPGVARNYGVGMSTAEVILFCDADVIPAPECLEAAWEAHLRGMPAVGGALVPGERTTIPFGLVEHFFFNHESQPGRPACSRKNLSSALMAIRRSIFLAHEGFKDIPRMQDTELTERLLKSGVPLTFWPAMIGFQRQDSTAGDVIRKVFINGNNLYFIRYAERHSVKRALILALLPLAGIAKVTRIILRYLRYGTFQDRWRIIACSTFLYFLGFCWSAGLGRAILFNKAVSARR